MLKILNAFAGLSFGITLAAILILSPVLGFLICLSSGSHLIIGSTMLNFFIDLYFPVSEFLAAGRGWICAECGND
jgi:hypothetical protein